MVASFGQGRNWVHSVKRVRVPVAARALGSFGARGVGFVWSEAGELKLGLFGARALGSFGANGARTHAACNVQECPSCQRASKKESRLRLAEFCPDPPWLRVISTSRAPASDKLKTLVENDQVKLFRRFISWPSATNSSSSSMVGEPLGDTPLSARKRLVATGLVGTGQVIRASGQESSQVAA